MKADESPQSLTDRILSRCVEDGGCLLWPGAMADRSCPQIRVGQKSINVRRYLWEQKHGPIPPGMVVSVKCECKRCIRHVELADTRAVRLKASANFTAAVHGRRVAMGRRRNSKVTPEIAREIRQGDETVSALAERYDLSAGYVASIRRGRQFKDYSNPFAALGA